MRGALAAGEANRHRTGVTAHRAVTSLLPWRSGRAHTRAADDQAPARADTPGDGLGALHRDACAPSPSRPASPALRGLPSVCAARPRRAGPGCVACEHGGAAGRRAGRAAARSSVTRAGLKGAGTRAQAGVVPLDIVILPRRSRHVSEAMVVLTEPMQLEIVLSRNQQPMGRNVVAVAQASKMVRADPLARRPPPRARAPLGWAACASRRTSRRGSRGAASGCTAHTQLPCLGCRHLGRCSERGASAALRSGGAASSPVCLLASCGTSPNSCGIGVQLREQRARAGLIRGRCGGRGARNRPG